jgi:DNA-binding LytR/AlgR family response regulator
LLDKALSMEEKRIYIVEDNISFALELEIYVVELGYQLMGVRTKAEEALAEIPVKMPDLVVMDINLAGQMNGLELAMALEPFDIPILFITVHDRPDYFEQARKTNWAGYLVKPFDKLSLQAAIEVALRYWQSMESGADAKFQENILRDDCMLIKSQGVYHKVAFSDIFYIQSEGNYSTIFTADRKFVLKISLRQLMEGLPLSDFIQVHKSYLVNLKKLDAIEATSDQLAVGKFKIPLSKSFRETLLSRFKVLK